MITLGVSHFCEKARWALQRYALEFREEAHAPMFHRGACKAAGGWGSVPCLRLPQPAADSGAGSDSGPSCVDQSTPILRWVDSRCAAEAAAGGRSPPPPLFPPGAAGAEVERLCGEFDSRLGPAARRWAYSHLLYTPAISAAMAAPPVPALERRAMASGGWWLTRRLMAKVRLGWQDQTLL